MLGALRVLTILLIACASRPSPTTPSSSDKLPERGIDAELIVQRAHADIIEAIAISPDGKLVASASRDRRVILWELGTGRAIVTLEGHKGNATAVAFSADGRLLASAGGFEDGTIKLWDPATGKLVRELHGPKGGASAVAFAGNLVISGHDDGSIRIWNRDGAEQTTLTGHRRGIEALAVSPDGKLLASGSQYAENDIRLWELPGGTPRGVMRADRETITSLAFSRDGRRLASGTGGFDALKVAVRVWDVASASELGKLSGHTGAVTRVEFAPDGKHLRSASRDGTLRVWNLDAYTETRSFEMPGVGTAAFSGDDRYLVTSVGNRLRLWGASTGEAIADFQGQPATWVHALAASPDGNVLLAGGGAFLSRDDFPTHVWSTTTGRLTGTLPAITGGAEELALSHDGRLVLALGADDKARLFELASGKLLQTIPSERGMGRVAEFTRDGRAFVLRLPRGSAYGDTLALVGLDGKPITTFDGRDKRIGSAALDPTGTRIAIGYGHVANDTHEIAIVDVATRRELALLVDHQAGISTLAWSPDGRTLASGSFDKTVRLWTLADYSPRVIGELGDVARGVAFSRDGTRLAAVGDDAKVRVWTLADPNAPPRELEGHRAGATTVTFLGGGTRFATGSRDGTIKVWDAAAAQPALASLAAVGEVDYIAYLPSNHYTATRGALAQVSFRTGGRTYPFEQFDLWLNRPDLVMTKLGAPQPAIDLAAAQYRARLQRVGFKPELFDGDIALPSLVVSDAPLATTDPKITIEVTATDAATPLDRMRVDVNDVPAFGMRGIPLDKKSTSLSRKIEIPLGRGTNKIQISVINIKGRESLQSTLYVTHNTPAQPANAYVVAIGVSKLRAGNGIYDLEYAAKDARDVGDAYQTKLARYGKVHTLVLTDQEVVREALPKIRAHLARASIDDLAVLFVAGHGLVADRQYYFATHDLDPEQPAKRGIPFEALQGTLDGIASRHKLLLMDTCFSGEGTTASQGISHPSVKRKDFSARGLVRTAAVARSPQELPSEGGAVLDLTQTLFADLRRDTGAAVISSSTGEEFSFESAEWRNGVFTYALMRAMRDGLADRNNDGFVSVRELETYVLREVRVLTLGEQNPTVRRDNLAVDFSVFAPRGIASLAVHQRMLGRGHREWVNGVAISDDGKLAVSASGDRTTKIWDLATGNELRSVAHGQDRLTSIDIAGTLVATGDIAATIVLWDLPTGVERQRLQGPPGVVSSVALSADGTLLASGHENKTIRLWDTRTGQQLHELTGHTHAVLAVALSSDGKRVVSGSADNTARIWDVATGSTTATLTGHSHTVHAVAFSFDGKLVATGDLDGTVKVWTAAGNPGNSFLAPKEMVYAVAFSPDGRMLLTGDSSNAMKLWDVASGRTLRKIDGHTNTIRSATFARDGKHILSGSQDMTVRWWVIEGG